MYPSDEFSESEYVDAERVQSDGHAAYREALREYIEGAPCSTCGLGANPAEGLWEKVMSANASNYSEPRIPEYTPGPLKIPQPSDFAAQRILFSIRPPGIAEHAIEDIREDWEEFSIARLEEPTGVLSSKLKQLSSDWVGRDFDSLEEKINRIVQRRNALKDDINETCTVLERQEEIIRNLQSTESGGLPLPPAQFRRIEPNGFLTKSVVHFRPPWHSGDCYEIEDEEIMDIMGIPRDFRDEIHQQVESRAHEIMEQKLAPMSASELESINESTFEESAYKEARDEIQEETKAYEQSIQGDYAAETDRISDDIAHRYEQVDSTLADSPYARGGPDQSPETGVGSPELTQPPATSTPDASLMAAPGGISDGSVPSPEEVASRPGGAGSRPNPGWSEASTDEEPELSDGLSSGSGGPSLATPGTSASAPGASGAGMGGPGGTVVAPGGRVGGGAVGSGGTGRPGSGHGSSRAGGTSSGAGGGRGGAGSGSGAGRGAGRGMGGPMGMMGGPMGGAGGQQGNQSGSKANRQTLGQMGRTTSGPTAPPAGTGAARGSGTGSSNAAGGNSGSRGGNAGGVGIAGGSQNRGNGKNNDAKGKGDHRTVGTMGRPNTATGVPKPGPSSGPTSTSKATGTSPSSNQSSKNSPSNLQNMIAAAKKANDKRAGKSNNAAANENAAKEENEKNEFRVEEDFEKLDIHDQQIVEDDIWGAYNKRFDQYR